MTITWDTPNPGPWQQDQAHAPAAMSRAVQELFPDPFNRGFTETFGRYGLLLDRLALAIVNGFMYHQPQPFDMPGPDGPPSDEFIGAEIGRRTALADESFATRRWASDLDDWDQKWKPEALRRHRQLGDVDLTTLDEAGIVAHLRDVAEHVDAMIYQHHRFNVAALLPVGDFALQAAGWTHRDPRSMLAALEGYSSISGVASDELADAVAALRANDELAALVTGDGDPKARLDDVRARYDWTVLLITHDIREAVRLSDRVVVLGPRPARVRREVTVGLPRPRVPEMVTTPAFAAVEAELLAILRGG